MSRIVLPSERRLRIVSQAVRRAPGSKPVVGSSRKISSGSPTSARPRSRRRFWPPESVRHARVGLVGETDDLDHLVDVARAARSSRRRRPGSRAPSGSGRATTTGARRRPARATRVPAALRVDAEHLDGAGVALPVALEDLDRRRLAGAVRAEQAEHLAGLDREVDAAERLVGAVALAQARALRPRSQLDLGERAGRERAAPPVSSRTISLQSGW